MALEPRQTYRLVPRGEPGLTCDSEGAALGGIVVGSRNDRNGLDRGGPAVPRARTDRSRS